MKPAVRIGLAPLAWLCVAALAVGETTPAPRRPTSANADAQDLLLLGPTRPLLVRLRVTIDGQAYREVWLKRFDELFAAEDRDLDGRVTIEQGDAIVRDMNGGLGDSPKSATADSPLRKSAGGDTVDRTTLAAYVEQVFPVFSLHPRAVVSQGAGPALFPLLDSNGDQQLTAEELAAAEARTRKRDFNDDGAISGFELLSDPEAIAAASNASAAPSEADRRDTPLVLIDAAMSPERIGELLVKRYDRNGDGQVSVSEANAEMSLPQAVQSRLDANGNGLLAGDELGSFAARTPDLELPIALGTVSAAERRRARQRLPVEDGWKARRKLDGGYELGLGEINVELDRDNRDPQQDTAPFRTYDRDNNEYVDEMEATTAGFGKGAFAAMDIDGDKKIFKGELSNYLDAQRQAAAARLQIQVANLGQDLFSILDLDMDGLLSQRELRTAGNVLLAEDRNGDNKLSGNELPLQIKATLLRGADPPTEEDALVSRRRVSSAGSSSGPLWFRKMDRNRDGDVSQREFIGPLDAFKKLDADSDGLVDSDEAEAAPGE
ncbi:MAG: hypothetical protein AB7O59_18105 [Pirellulales bacterium]